MGTIVADVGGHVRKTGILSFLIVHVTSSFTFSLFPHIDFVSDSILRIVALSFLLSLHINFRFCFVVVC
jgi:hypothetical protein